MEMKRQKERRERRGERRRARGRSGVRFRACHDAYTGQKREKKMSKERQIAR